MIIFLLLLLLAAQSIFFLMVVYLLLLTGAARRATRHTPLNDQQPIARLLILIPAYNEEKLLSACLESILQSDYPPDKYAVHVIADNCTDRTAEIAREYTGTVHERTNKELSGKGYALRWAVDRLANEITKADGIIILDADSVISKNFFRVMAARLASGENVVQAFYTVQMPEQSPASSLRYAALAVLHYLRPQGRMVLGGSAGLKGNGMLFTSEILARYPWPSSLTEDIEYHMTLLLAGERVTFAPDAVVWGEMPATLSQSRSQHDRWEKGRLGMAKRYIPRLLASARQALRESNQKKAFIYLDAVMEHLIPPFSILAGFTFAALCSGFVLGLISINSPAGHGQQLLAGINMLLGIGLIIGQVIYLLNGLFLVSASKKIYRSLLFAPLLIIWKIWQYFRISLRKQPQEWVRTARNEG